ncbi:hypothetical protein DIPPA_19664 [Diplonema papillatum]|nr:hypothetical protein DIPPA_19664 [Diplonema papillatum]
MDRINVLIQEARGMAELAALDELDAVYGIIDVATTLLRRRIEARSGKPANREAKGCVTVSFSIGHVGLVQIVASRPIGLCPRSKRAGLPVHPG